MVRTPVRLLAMIFAFWLGNSETSHAAAPPTHEVLQLVPTESSLCFVLQDLREHSRKLTESPFAAWLETSTFGKAVIASADYRKLMAAAQAVSANLGVSIEELRDDVFGDVVVMAYLPAPPEKPELEAGLLLVRARDPKKLARLVARLNEIQLSSGELVEVVARTHKSRDYFERKKKAGKSEYYRLTGSLLLASSQEHALQRAIECETRVGAAPLKPGPEAPFVVAMDRLGLNKAAAVLLFHPRTFDADWAARIRAAANPGEKALLSQFAQIWSAIDAIGLALHLDKDAELTIGAAMAEKRLPEAIRPLLAPTEPSLVWAAIPQDALVAVAGRLDLPNILAGAQSFLPADARAGLQKLLDQSVAPIVGKDQLPTVLRGIGPDWGLWLTVPEKGSRVPALTFALRLQPKDGKDQSLFKAARNALDFAFQTFRVEYNRTHDDEYTIGEATAGSDRITYLANEKALPAGVRPAFAIRGEFLVVASTVEAVQKFVPPTAAPKEAAGLVFRCAVGKLGEYLTENKQPLAELLAGWSGRKPAEVAAEFADATSLFELARTIELRRTDEKGRIQVSLRVQFARPLAK